MSGHTEGRLTFRANGDANSYALIGDDGRWWMSVLMNGEQMTERQESNLRRLAACWNACEGIDTGLIEPRMLGDQIAAKMAVIDKCDRLNTENAALNDYCATVEQQRDRLLAAASAAADQIRRCDYTPARSTLLQAVAAIAKATAIN